MFENNRNQNYPGYNNYNGYDGYNGNNNYNNGYNDYQDDYNQYDDGYNSYDDYGNNNSYHQGNMYEDDMNYNQNGYNSGNGYGQNTSYIPDVMDNTTYIPKQNTSYLPDVVNNGSGYNQSTSYLPDVIGNNSGYNQSTSYLPDINDGPGYNNSYDDTMQMDDMMDDYYDDGLDGNVSIITPAKSHAMLGTVLSLLLVGIVGILVGKLSNDSATFANFWQNHIYSSSYLTMAASVLLIVLFAYFSSIAHIILHEVGHLIGGTFTNYSLVSFRIFAFTWVKDGNKTKMKKYDIPGTAGECVMMPPQNNNGKYSYMLYNLGGILMNMITSVIAVVLYLKVGAFGEYPKNMFCILFAIVGLITILYNGIPLIINGIPNDGYTIMQMMKSVDARNAVHANLLISAYLARGGRYSDIPYEQFYTFTNGDYDGHLAVKVKLKEYRWHLEHMDFAKAIETLNSMDYCYKKLPRVYQYEINSEKLFMEIICNNNPDNIERLYNIDVKKYLEDTQGMMSSNRVMMAYEACVTGNMKLAHKRYNMLQNGVKTEPLQGEIDLELMLGQYIYESYCQNEY